MPWTFIPNLDPKKKKDIAFRSEAFCGLFAETALDTQDPADFISKAVTFANETLWGNLTGYISVADNADANIKSAVEQGITDLKYGTVCVNHYAGLANVFMSAPWGAYPGNTMDDIQSGNGSVNNLFMFEKIQKGVFRAPFKKQPDNIHAHAELCRFYQSHRKIIWQADMDEFHSFDFGEYEEVRK